MRPVSATYRLQFRNGMTFARAAELAPYLARLGISHLYASPVQTALPGSSHGYDVARYDAIEQDLGGEAGFRAMAEAFGGEGIGILLDFVPNHMGASPLNPWWRDVLEWGAQSPRASYFDIDWSAPKLLIPVLPEPYGVVLASGFGLDFDGGDGGINFTVAGLKLPISPPTYAGILARAASGFEDLANRFAIATPETAEALKTELAARAEEPAQRGALLAALKETVADSDALHALHEAQIWRLAYWRAARETLTYRRFFEVADLVGVRMEQPSVFEETHRAVVELARERLIDGLRLDHVDGLADPLGYLRKLREATGEESTLLVEKILGAGEELRSEWPVQGTTGYEFIRSLGGVLTSPSGEKALTEAYVAFTGEAGDYAALLAATKRHIFVRNLAGELDVLTLLAVDLARADLATRDYGRDTLRRAIIELAVALPVYRTYVDVDGPRPEDEELIARAEAKAKSTREVEDEGAIDFVARIWRLGLDDPAARAQALTFVTRLQQTTGPLMAKAVEDTLFYRYNRLVALNEVGGSPDAFGCDLASFHTDMQARQARQPHGLLATSTHDTKRGEDARARLYALSETPEAWAEHVGEWTKLNTNLRSDTADDRAPTANDEWLFYQSLAGAWPFGLDVENAQALGDLAGRMAQFMLKAIREAKVRTSWTAPSDAYEKAVEQFVRGALDPSRSRAFVESFSAVLARLEILGALNSLTQTLIKLAAPGVPDIYQGAELWELSLVDPDNRRPVDFFEREGLLSGLAARKGPELVGDWRGGLLKLFLIQKGLAARRAAPGLFTSGRYVPLAASGPQAGSVLAFSRSDADQAAIALAPIRAGRLLGDSPVPLISPATWSDTRLLFPPEWRGRRWYNLLTDETLTPDTNGLRIAGLLERFPVALLVTD
jgi:(1->4)-alpha-D-glucan 1-alpha-D-glucosylmutase